MPVKRKRKIEAPRLAGIGLLVAGLVALVLVVIGAQHAGAATVRGSATSQTGDAGGLLSSASPRWPG